MEAGSYEDEEFVPSGQLRTELGGISDMTLWRWLKDPKLDFPNQCKFAIGAIGAGRRSRAGKAARSQKREAM